MTALEELTTNSSRDHTLPKDQTLKGSSCWQMVNERITEDIVREHLKKDPFYPDKIVIEEQKSQNPRINKILQSASKKGIGAGKPEFIVSFIDEPNLVLIIECKADIAKHESNIKDHYSDFAVDGVLLYSSHLAKEFNVIAIAVSGEKKSDLKISTFLQLQNNNVKDLKLTRLLKIADYMTLYKKDPEKEKISVEELIRYSKELNNKLRDDFELEEGQRPLLVSGILIALEDKAFATSYVNEKRAIDLAKSLTKTIEKILEQHSVDQKRRADMVNVYSFIETNNNIAEDLNNIRNTKLRDLITEINGKVRGFMKDYKYHDILGQFYAEFLRYANGDKGLGIVLTPKHVTDIFVEIAKINKNSVVLDNCCGTGGFLISSMKKMLDEVEGDSEKTKVIHNKQLIGIENNSKMFCLACSNMLLRGDGKSNIFYNNCFEIDKEPIKKLKPDVGFLNPPYSKKKEGSEELSYVLNCLEFLEKNGICVAIVPMRCAIKYNTLKTKLLEKHTLEAVMSMPNDLFYPMGTNPCIMVFRAHVPHDKDVETWFGYWKDDGFIIIKNEGRIDKNNQYENKRKIWFEDFRSRREVEGRCVKKKIKAEDEWCAEAYMETDYSSINESDFINSMTGYCVYKMQNDGMMKKAKT